MVRHLTLVKMCLGIDGVSISMVWAFHFHPQKNHGIGSEQSSVKYCSSGQKCFFFVWCKIGSLAPPPLRIRYEGSDLSSTIQIASASGAYPGFL